MGYPAMVSETIKLEVTEETYRHILFALGIAISDAAQKQGPLQGYLSAMDEVIAFRFAQANSSLISKVLAKE